MSRDDTFWGAYHIDLEELIKETVRKLGEIGIPSPKKLEASALIAYRQKNNINFMSNEEIKKFIMNLRGFKI